MIYASALPTCCKCCAVQQAESARQKCGKLWGGGVYRLPAEYFILLLAAFIVHYTHKC